MLNYSPRVSGLANVWSLARTLLLHEARLILSADFEGN